MVTWKTEKCLQELCETTRIGYGCHRFQSLPSIINRWCYSVVCWTFIQINTYMRSIASSVHSKLFLVSKKIITWTSLIISWHYLDSLWAVHGIGPLHSSEMFWITVCMMSHWRNISTEDTMTTKRLCYILLVDDIIEEIIENWERFPKIIKHGALEKLILEEAR